MTWGVVLLGCVYEVTKNQEEFDMGVILGKIDAPRYVLYNRWKCKRVQKEGQARDTGCDALTRHDYLGA